MMTKSMRLWTGLGLGLTVMASQTTPLLAEASVKSQVWIVAQAATDGGGEGEGGGETPTTYALASTDEKAFDYDASAQVAAYAELVQDAYDKAYVEAGKLNSAIDVLLAAPTAANLAEARKAWVAARPAYLRTEAFRFYDGPIEDVEGFINAWPMNEAYLDYVEGQPDSGLINDSKFEIGNESIRNRNQQDDEANVATGWHAIEFLLWGQDLSTTTPGQRPYADFVADSEAANRRRMYLKTVTDSLVEDIKSLADAWYLADPKSYAVQFSKLPQREALGRILNGIAILAGFEFMSERLAVALDSGDQEDEHSCFSDTTKQDFVYDLQGIKQVWTGDSSGVARAGLDDLLKARDPGLAAKIEALLADAETKIATLGDPWDQVLATPKGSPERAAAEAAVIALQSLSDGFKEAGANLGVLVLVPTG